jgi:hypothetical protein
MRNCPVVENSQAKISLLVSVLSQFEFLDFGVSEVTQYVSYGDEDN